MNYDGRREWIESQIRMLMGNLRDLQENVDYADPGIYYQYLRESQSIEHRIQDLLNELEVMDKGV